MAEEVGDRPMLPAKKQAVDKFGANNLIVTTMQTVGETYYAEIKHICEAGLEVIGVERDANIDLAIEAAWIEAAEEPDDTPCQYYFTSQRIGGDMVTCNLGTHDAVLASATIARTSDINRHFKISKKKALQKLNDERNGTSAASKFQINLD